MISEISSVSSSSSSFSDWEEDLKEGLTEEPKDGSERELGKEGAESRDAARRSARPWPDPNLT